MELCRAGLRQPPAWKEDKKALSSPTSSSTPLPAQSAAGGLRVGPAPIQAIQQDRKPSCSCLPASAGQVGRITCIVLGNGTKGGPAHQGRPRLGKKALSNGRGAQGCPPPASEWFGGPRSTTHAIPYSTAETKSLHPHVKLQPACSSLFWARGRDQHKGQAGKDKFTSLSQRLLKAFGEQHVHRHCLLTATIKSLTRRSRICLWGRLQRCLCGFP